MLEDHSAPAWPGRLTAREWLLLLALAAVQFTHVVDFMIILPLGPQFQRVLHIGPQAFGVLVSAYGFAASLSGLLAARFVDRFDRKRALLVLYTGFTAGTLLCAIGGDYWLLLVARTVTGGFGGVVAATVLAIVSDAFPASRRATAMGVVMSSWSVGMIFGVPLGLYLANAFGWWMPFTVLGACCLAMLVLAALVLPPLRGHLVQCGSEDAPTLLQVMLHPNHLRAYGLMVTLVLGGFMLGAYLPSYMVANVGLAEGDLPYLYLTGGLTTLLTVTLFGRLSDRFGKLLIFRIMALVTVVPTLVLANLPPVPVWVAIAVATVFMVTTSGRMVPAQAMIAASAAPRYRGSFLSVTASVQQMSSGLASVLAGLILGTPSGAGEGPGFGALPEANAPLAGFGWVGLLAAGFTLLSVVLGGSLRAARGGLEAVDSVAAPEGEDRAAWAAGDGEPAAVVSASD
jgi:predicted MFS family arabinose efflux permease